jgi:hypothetical protein
MESALQIGCSLLIMEEGSVFEYTIIILRRGKKTETYTCQLMLMLTYYEVGCGRFDEAKHLSIGSRSAVRRGKKE